MGTLDRLKALLSHDIFEQIDNHQSDLTEVRLRAGRPVQMVWIGGEALCGAPLDPEQLHAIVTALMDYSYYARESELSQGFFTLNDGSRVGVCGRIARNGADCRMTEISSICLRIARSVPGCADGIMSAVDGKRGLKSTLILSRPGLGKTTLLRDIARQLSEAGRRVSLADERHELAACRMGMPTLDVGPRTDVLDGCPRPLAIATLIRSMGPDVIVTDEIGGEGDAKALADAARCGVAVAASAHADSVEAALARSMLRAAIREGAFHNIVLLGRRPGEIRQVLELDGGGGTWKSA